ncbi:hypothetical protein [Caldisalinibacter kiritimatiensis]|uniref:Virulence-related protein n=1 Tax=Caldisalinibacter kiritimatiensis TaxID=1304284 RepID=R1CRN4_9FIRM|nr:hypothetical protein [Caldisalinibacter kiritimatiensis]EOC99363.1 virulence-related protein [Caldisalinibacter kiritimatiensis]
MDRKELVKKLSEHFGVKSKYLGAPSFAYQIETEGETYTIDREGRIIKRSGEEIQFKQLLKGPEKVEPKELETRTANETLAEDIVIILPMADHSGKTLRNLVNMIYSKQDLIKKALEIEKDLVKDDFAIGINEVKIETLEDFKTALEDIGKNSCPSIEFNFYDKKIYFNFLQVEEENTEKIKVYKQFVSILNENAKKLKHASAKAKPTDNEKYTFKER